MEQELFIEYPQLKNKNIYYLYESGTVNKNATLKENKIKHNANILINLQ